MYKEECENHELAISVSPLHKDFFYHALHAISKESKKKRKTVLERILLEEDVERSRRYDSVAIQDSFVVRTVKKARYLSFMLIADDGTIDDSALADSIQIMKKGLYPLGPRREGDALRNEHLLHVLTMLSEEQSIRDLVAKIHAPSGNRHAEKIVRDTLRISQNKPLNDALARRAVLSALMCYLRQNVGSCFATAPAIIIQKEQPERFLKDMADLLGMGRLQRTFGGVEHSVPLSVSIGVADLNKPFKIVLADHAIVTEVWEAPGIVRAFEAAGIVEGGKQSAKRKRCREIVASVIEGLSKSGGSFWTTAETIIRKALLRYCGIKDEDVKAYKKNMYSAAFKRGGLLVPLNVRGESSTVTACRQYIDLYEKAVKAFTLLTENPLLKAWEYTIASLCDTKTDFSRWNLYASLGFEEDSPHGIGACLYEKIKEKLDEANRESHEYHEQYDILFPHVKQLEVRIHHAKDEQDARWIRMEYQRSVNELNTYQIKRDRAHQKAQLYAELFSLMMHIFLNAFPRYFQEVYDADLHEITSASYDDSPAGFRLLYKHGRSDPSMWTLIYDETEFVESLVRFFIAIEADVIGMPELKGFEHDIGEMITGIVLHVKTKEFLESAFYRMAVAHNVVPIEDPLNNLDRIEKKPWVYTSGGTINTLVRSYYRLDQNPFESERWVESAAELCGFFIDNMKSMAANISDRYIENPQKSMLIHSPTHVFILKPGAFKEGWLSDLYTYTWVRDTLITPQQDTLTAIHLDGSMIKALLSMLEEKYIDSNKKQFDGLFTDMTRRISPRDFRERVMQCVEQSSLLMREITAEDIDSMLYSSLPLLEGYRVRGALESMFETFADLDAEEKKRALALFDTFSERHPSVEYISADEFQNICKALILCIKGKTSFEVDYSKRVNARAQELNLALPPPLFFADSNWTSDLFGFVVNPGTERFELWNFESDERRGMPMIQWKQWIDGSRKKPTWGIYTKPYQYGE